MNRKHNGLLSLAALVLLALVLVLTCTGCKSSKGGDPGRFTYERKFLGDGRWETIITDTETGVQYLHYSDHGGAGMTKLED